VFEGLDLKSLDIALPSLHGGKKIVPELQENEFPPTRVCFPLLSRIWSSGMANTGTRLKDLQAGSSPGWDPHLSFATELLSGGENGQHRM